MVAMTFGLPHIKVYCQNFDFFFTWIILFINHYYLFFIFAVDQKNIHFYKIK